MNEALESENEAVAWADVLNYARPNSRFWAVKGARLYAASDHGARHAHQQRLDCLGLS